NNRPGGSIPPFNKGLRGRGGRVIIVADGPAVRRRHTLHAGEEAAGYVDRVRRGANVWRRNDRPRTSVPMHDECLAYSAVRIRDVADSPAVGGRKARHAIEVI